MTKKIKAIATRIFTIRFTDLEFKNLTNRAANAGMTIAAYIRHRLFGEHEQPRVRRVKAVICDERKLSKVLALLGGGRYASNLNQTAKAINQGIVSFSAEKEASVHEACLAVAQMRDLLVDAITKQ